MTDPVSPVAMWDERYRLPTYAYGLAPNAFLAGEAHRLRPGMRALVPGDGEGRNGVWLAEQGLEVDTLDLSAFGVEKAKRLAAERGVSINAAQADAVTWDWPSERYDLIALIYLHLAEAERRMTHSKALAALKPGGLIVLEAFRPEQLQRHALGTRGGPRDRALLYSVEALQLDFAGEDILMLGSADPRIDEGRLHLGESAVVRAIVRKR